MRLAVILFPGSDDDVLMPLREVSHSVDTIWYQSGNLDGFDAVILPGGYTYGDYLRPGALAAASPVMDGVRSFAAIGGLVIGLGNGFQILCEAGLLPGGFLPNESGRFVCTTVHARVEQSDTALTRGLAVGDVVEIPVAHQTGYYYLDDETLARVESEGQVLFRYVTPTGEVAVEANPNGSVGNIAGVMNEGKNVIGLMGHPQRNYDGPLGNGDGKKLFESLRNFISVTAKGATP